jgi:hypothetical protein
MAHSNLPVRFEMPTPLVPLPSPPRRPRASPVWGLAFGLALALGLGLVFASLWGAGAAPPTMHVAPLIVAEPWIPTLVPIQVGPPELVPQRGWIRITGLPTLASLSEGHAIARGSWSVPVERLLGLAITAPTGEDIRSSVTIALVSPRGSVLAEAQSMLVVVPASRLFPTSGHSPARRQSDLETTCPEVAAGQRADRAPKPSPVASEHGNGQRAEMLVQAGNKKMADGNVAAAREFYRHAAEMGWSPAAFALGATYDPSHAQLPGASADPQKAQCWYARARELTGLEAASLKN